MAFGVQPLPTTQIIKPEEEENIQIPPVQPKAAQQPAVQRQPAPVQEQPSEAPVQGPVLEETEEVPGEAPRGPSLFVSQPGRRYMEAYTNLMVPQPEPTREEPLFVDETEPRRGVAFMEGVKQEGANVIEGFEFITNLAQKVPEWFTGEEIEDVDWEAPWTMRDDLTESEELWKTGGQVVTIVGSFFAGGAGLAAKGTQVAKGTHAALTAAGMAEKPARMIAFTSKWGTIGVGESVAMQFLLDPEEERFADMAMDALGFDDSTREAVKGDPLNAEIQSRGRAFVKDMADFATFTTLFGLVGKGFLKFRAKRLKDTVNNPYKEMAGLGESDLSKLKAIEEKLLDEGWNVEEVVSRVSSKVHGGDSLEETLSKLDTGVTIEDAQKWMVENPVKQQRAIARDLVEQTSEDLNPQLPFRAVDSLESQGALSEHINLITRNQEEKILRSVGQTPAERAAKNGVTRRLSDWMTKIKSTVGFDAGAQMRRLDKYRYGFDTSTYKGHRQALEMGLNPVHRSGTLYDNLFNTLQTRIMQWSGAGGKPMVSTTFDDLSGVAEELGIKSFGDIARSNNLSDEEFLNVLNYITAKRVKVITEDRAIHGMGEVQEHYFRKTEKYAEWLALGKNASKDFHNAVDDFRDLMNGLLYYRYRHGGIRPDEYRRILNASKDTDGVSWYIPLTTHAEAGSKYKGKGTGLLPARMKGNTGSVLLDAPERVSREIIKTVSGVETNKVKQAFYSQLEAMRKSDLAGHQEIANETAVKMGSKEWADDTEFRAGLIKNLRDLIARGETDMINPGVIKQIDAGVDVPTGDLIKALGPNGSTVRVGEDAMDVVYFNGKSHVYKVKDSLTRDALEALGPRKMITNSELGKKALAATKGLTRIKAHLITKEPLFVLTAIFRELFTSAFLGGHSKIPGATYMKGVLNYSKALDAAMNGGFSVRSARLAAATEDLGSALEAARGASERAYIKNMQMQAKNIFRKGGAWYVDFVNKAESMAKLGEIQGMIERGLSPEAATQMANGLMPYGRQTTSAMWSTLGDHMFFLRPSAIGISRAAEVMKNNPKASSMFFGGMLGADLALDRVNALYEEDMSVPEWANFVNYHIPNLADWSQSPQLIEAAVKGDPSLAPPLDKHNPYFISPGPHELATVEKMTKDLGKLAIRRMSGDETSTDSLLKIMDRFYQGTFAVYGETPDVAAPLVALITGEDRWGNKIVPEKYARLGDVSTQWGPTTRPAMITFSEMLSAVGVDVHADALDWGAGWLLPGIGEYALNVVDAGVGGRTLDTRHGASGRSAWPVEYFGQRFMGRYTLGRSELNKMTSTMYDLQQFFQDNKKKLRTMDATTIMTEDMLKHRVELSNGDSVPLYQMNTLLTRTMAKVKEGQLHKEMVMRRLGRYANYTDEQARDTLSNIDASIEELARDQILHLAHLDLVRLAKKFDGMTEETLTLKKN